MTRKEKRLVWEERISSYKQSGLSIAKWCDENNVVTAKLDSTVFHK